MKVDISDVGKYKPGDQVFAKKLPNVALIVRRYVGRIYYCKLKHAPNQSEEVLFEREIVGS
jgi:hypothetical protein